MTTRSILARNNRTLHWEIQVSDGQMFTEKCRDSIGGFSNLMARLETHFGGRLRSNDQGQSWEVNGLTVTLTEVQKG